MAPLQLEEFELLHQSICQTFADPKRLLILTPFTSNRAMSLPWLMTWDFPSQPYVRGVARSPAGAG